jgi:hypothetical protein
VAAYSQQGHSPNTGRLLVQSSNGEASDDDRVVCLKLLGKFACAGLHDSKLAPLPGTSLIL